MKRGHPGGDGGPAKRPARCARGRGLRRCAACLICGAPNLTGCAAAAVALPRARPGPGRG